MYKLFYSPIHSLVSTHVLFLLALAMTMASSSSVAATSKDFCQGGRQIHPLSMYYSERIRPVGEGIPLDIAIRSQQNQIQHIQDEAKLAFLRRPPESFLHYMEDYTFLIPDQLKDSYGMDMLVGFGEISSALKYRKQLWRQFIEQFTTVKEAPSEGDDPNVLRFEVSLDLSFFCRYRQKVQDLVTHSVVPRRQ